MAALTEARDINLKGTDIESRTVADTVTIYYGGVVGIDENDEAIAASADADLRVRGLALETVDNTDDGEDVRIERGPAKWLANGTATVTADDIGHNCFVQDDQTVGMSPAATCVAGEVFDVDATRGVLVAVGRPVGGDPVYLAPAADAALQLGSQLHGGVVNLNSTTGAKVISTATRVRAGTRVVLYAGTLSGGSYTLVVTGGTLTIDAANETAEVFYDGSAWKVMYLRGATIL